MNIIKKVVLVFTLMLAAVTLIGCEEKVQDSDLDKIESITINFETNSESTINSIVINQDLLDNIDLDEINDVELSDLEFLNPIKEGFLFENWYFDIELTEVLSPNSPILNEYLKLLEEETVNIEITIYAKWEEVDDETLTEDTIYTITYHLNGGVNDLENVSEFKASDNEIILLSPTKTDASFLGWYLDEEFTTSISTISKGTEMNIEVWAKWGDVSVFTFHLDNNEYTIVGFDMEFSGVLVIPDTFNGLPVTKIGYGAFSMSEGITEVIIGKNITAIGSNAFKNCKNLVSITIPDNVESIGESAFEHCDSLESVVIGDGITSIGNFTFNSCGSLTTVILGENVISIGRQSFSHTGLTSITLNDKLEFIDDSSFYNCDLLTSITIPSSVTYVGQYVFHNCDNLIIYVSLDKIPDGWHSNWNSSSLQVVLNGDTPPTVYTISYELNGGTNDSSNPSSHTNTEEKILKDPTKEGSIFLGWYTDSEFNNKITSLSIYIDSDITLYALWVEDSAPQYLTYEEFDDYVVITGVTDSRSEIEIPSTYNGKPVTTIKENSFYNNRDLTTVILPETITTIEKGAFWFASNLITINFPSSLVIVGDYAFAGCGFTSLDLPETIITYGEEVFANNEYLVSVILPDNMTIIREGFFQNCNMLESINIPASVTEIQKEAFADCMLLGNVDLTNVGVIGENAFSNCQSMTSIILSDSLTVIDDYAFAYTVSVTEVILPENLEIIGNSAFTGLYNLTLIDFPDTLTFIGESAFYGCSLTELVLPNSLVTIGEEAFRYNDFEYLYLPSSLYKIEKLAFRNCENLKEIMLSTSIDVIEERIFRDTGSQVVLYVDSASVPSAWATEWNDYFEGGIVYSSTFSTININYSLNGGENHADNPLTLLINNNLVVRTPTKEGYNFVGWYIDSGLTETISIIKQGTIEDINLYAKWELIADNQHSIIYHLDGGTNLNGSPTYFNEDVETTLLNPTKAGWKFLGWYTNSNYSDLVTSIEVNTSSDVELYALWEQDYLIFEEFDDYVVVTGLKQPLIIVEIPSTYNGKTVTTIGKNCFMYETVIMEVILPDTITTIEEHAFSADNLETINLPEGLVVIGDYAFSSNNEIKEIIIPSTVISIGESVFASCGKLLNVVFNNPITVITKGMFEDSVGLKTIVIPEGVTQIESNAFNGCDNLTNIILPSTLLRIDRYAFAYTPNLITITLPANLQELGDGVFYETGLVSLTLPNSLTTIGEQVWIYNRDLETLTLGASLSTQLTYRDFVGLDSLAAINVDSENQMYNSENGVLYGNYDSYTLVRYPAAKTETNYDINEETVTIAVNAFMESSLENITIPDTVTTIGEYAFESCEDLIRMYLSTNIVSIGSGAFSSNDYLVIYVGYDALPEGWDEGFSDSNNTVYYGIAEDGYGIYQDIIEYIILEDHVEITHIYTNNSSIINYDIPSVINGLPVTTIHSYVLVDVRGDIIIPASVITIDYRAFYNAAIDIYCEAFSKPEGWDNQFTTSSATVTWSVIWFKMDSQGGNYSFPIVGLRDDLKPIGRGWVPVREGYTFGGWYTNPLCTEGNEFTFTQFPGQVDTMPTAVTIIYAKWIQ